MNTSGTTLKSFQGKTFVKIPKFLCVCVQVYPDASTNENLLYTRTKPRFGGKIMPNVGLPKSLDTDLNTAGSDVELNRHQHELPLLRKALSDNFGRSLHNDNDDDEELDGIGELGIQQTSEERPKNKTRSRFSSAFRSFRGAKSLKKKTPIPIPVDTVLSSGGEDLETASSANPTPVKKKKNKFSKKFSLSGIKKNKVNPKKEETPQHSGQQLVSSSTQTTQTLDRRTIFLSGDEPNRKVTVTTTPTSTSTPPTPESSPTKFDKVRKIQITIQGKKIEHTNNKSGIQQARKNLPTTTTEITTSAIASPDPTSIDDVDYLTAAEEPAQQKSTTNTFRRNSKKKLKSKSKSNSPPTPTKSISTTISTTTTTEEKLVVTQSICDTPPRERAPAKPSRTLSPPPPSIPTATTGGVIRKTLSHQIPKLRRQRSHVVDSPETESNFMIREGGVERGRRFPRPSSIDSKGLPSLDTAQFHSLPTPLGAPDSFDSQSPEAETKSLPPLTHETPNEPQADPTPASSKEPILLPTFSTTSTTSIVSVLEIEKPPSPARSPTTNAAATTRHELFTGNNIQNPNLSGSINDQSPEDHDDPPPVREFAVGTPVRPQRTSVPLSQVTFDSKDFSSITSQSRSPSDQSLASDNSIHRRKITYIDQSSICNTDEEHDISGGKRGFSEYSFDSEFSVEAPMPAFGDLTMDQEDPPIMTSSTEKREHLYKILVIGELGTGKTSFIKRYVHQFFSQNYRATIGVDFALKVLHWDSNTIVRLQLWDIAGQERFGNMTRVYYKEAVGAFIVFDVTRSGTFDCVSKWKEDLDSKVQLPDGSPIPCILLANKCDQDKQGIVTTPEKMDEYVRENGFAGWFETSAKENINIDEAARALVNKILLNDKLISAADIADSEKFNLASTNGGQTTTQAIKSKCSC